VKVKVAAVMPLTRPTDEENISAAIGYLDEAIGQGAKIICFPEHYIHGEATRLPLGNIESYPGIAVLRERAKEHGIYIVPGTVAERAEENNFYNTAVLIDDKGEIAGKYRKTHLSVGESRVAGDREEVSKVFRTQYGNVGIHVCYEICFPEVARVTALAGADMIFWPCGGKFYEIRETWRHLIWARAIENLTYIIACCNLYGMERGIAMIAGPEDILAETDREGVISATLDIDRIRWLRATPESYEVPKPFKCVPGTFKDRRPELYGSLCG